MSVANQKPIEPITLIAGKTLVVSENLEVAVDATVGIIHIQGSKNTDMVSINIKGEASTVANIGSSVDFKKKSGYILNASGEEVTLVA